MSEDFISIEIIKKDGQRQQYLKLVKEDGTKTVYALNDFPWRGGGPVITGEYKIQFEKKE